MCYNTFMEIIISKLKSAATATVILFASVGAVYSQSYDLDVLFDRLQKVDAVDATALEAKIVLEWSKSGSAAFDLLLTQAKIAIDAQDHKTAMQHLNALTDHAPNFAEGWNLTAVTLFNMGKIGPSLEAIERTLALEPRHFRALEGLVFILEDSGLYKDAFDVVLMIESIHPHAEILSKSRDRLEVKIQGQAL